MSSSPWHLLSLSRLVFLKLGFQENEAESYLHSCDQVWCSQPWLRYSLTGWSWSSNNKECDRSSFVSYKQRVKEREICPTCFTAVRERRKSQDQILLFLSGLWTTVDIEPVTLYNAQHYICHPNVLYPLTSRLRTVPAFLRSLSQAILQSQTWSQWSDSLISYFSKVDRLTFSVICWYEGRSFVVVLSAPAVSRRCSG